MINLGQEQKQAALEVIIPIKDRKEVKQCVNSLLDTKNIIKKILLIDGGSTDSDCLTVFDELEKNPKIKIIHSPQSGFNKSKLLNQGIQATTSDFLLISDADIIWNITTLQNLLKTVLSSSNIICSVKDVQESQPLSVELHRQRYIYQIDYHGDTAILQIVSASPDKKRPGCGLVCTGRSSFFELGGYKEIFKGWGWEDQDLLIRASLLGFQVYTQGKVLHLSHSDASRNLYNDNLSPVQTRNQNILFCIESLIQGHLQGDLFSRETEPNKKDSPKLIQVQLPKELNDLRQLLK